MTTPSKQIEIFMDSPFPKVNGERKNFTIQVLPSDPVTKLQEKTCDHYRLYMENNFNISREEFDNPGPQNKLAKFCEIFIERGTYLHFVHAAKPLIFTDKTTFADLGIENFSTIYIMTRAGCGHKNALE